MKHREILVDFCVLDMDHTKEVLSNKTAVRVSSLSETFQLLLKENHPKTPGANKNHNGGDRDAKAGPKETFFHCNAVKKP
jgi:hypothetical protein